MDQISLSNVLSISEEDAAFLQRVLDEVDGNINQNTDEEGNTENLPDESVDITSVVEQANTEPALTKIMEDDNESTSRFSSAIWYEKIQNQTIILAGLGGIGRF